MSDKNEIVARHLRNFASLTDNDIAAGQPFWKPRTIKKGDFFNMQSMVCTDLGLVVKGIFRIYYHDPKTDTDKNLFFFSENQFVVSFRSFISQKACWYYIEAMEDSEIVFISYKDLNSLYETNANWAKFGRLLAELFFAYAQTRTEEFVFFSHEERYLRLLEEHPNIVERIPAYHISSFLGITNPSLSRIRKRIKK
ncbi:Crp/Fnr family transcriptional regulator [Dyadobacter psychrophilus]|uniref:cAMP-binding domain of CRP or a regulatory subunit of cAMP-dependent protein kinases n=1 Tax=Dyadobacter psychrophilus TaxID=651661 RepID=A0A1T5E1S2_9BACT|nr:Crp/Fnr family transcriptional regulator [Dyadobacter psychrophilus]SKB77700.1 cAMP-binding domain of CRP or a regulatory subunit of cAMP-dependent protein kinases [Dyadobacter psychrophilus]